MKVADTKKQLTTEQCDELLKTLKTRFDKHMDRHTGIEWSKVQKRLEAKPDKLWSLFEMERSGGEPDVVGYDKKSGEFAFIDCSPETPKGRTNTCYDRKALDARKEHKPKTSAMDLAVEMGIEILSEEQYRDLQTLGDFDQKTSSWIKTPDDIRELGGALFCDRRFGHVFLYHNGAQSYYGVRGFRGLLRV